MSVQSKFFIRRYTQDDRDAVRRICVETAWCGEPAPKRIGDPWIWAEFWTRFYTDRLPYHSWVVEEEGTYDIVGYLQGSHNAALVDHYVPFLLPGLIRRWCAVVNEWGRPAGEPLLRMSKSFLKGEMNLPPGIAERYPATFHFNLMPEARGQGLGSKLLACFLDRMCTKGVPGIHVQTLSVNEAVSKFLIHHGFQLIDERTLSAFGDGGMRICTWVDDSFSGH